MFTNLRCKQFLISIIEPGERLGVHRECRRVQQWREAGGAECGVRGMHLGGGRRLARRPTCPGSVAEPPRKRRAARPPFPPRRQATGGAESASPGRPHPPRVARLRSPTLAGSTQPIQFKTPAFNHETLILRLFIKHLCSAKPFPGQGVINTSWFKWFGAA